MQLKRIVESDGQFPIWIYSIDWHYLAINQFLPVLFCIQMLLSMQLIFNGIESISNWVEWRQWSLPSKLKRKKFLQLFVNEFSLFWQQTEVNEQKIIHNFNDICDDTHIKCVCWVQSKRKSKSHDFIYK